MADIDNLPRVVKRRVNALKNLQVKCAQIEAKFYEEVHDLERKYAVLYQPLFDKQFEIINAIYEPTEEECEWKPDEEDEISVGIIIFSMFLYFGNISFIVRWI